jgi:hypothetical protein
MGVQKKDGPDARTKREATPPTIRESMRRPGGATITQMVAAPDGRPTPFAARSSRLLKFTA